MQTFEDAEKILEEALPGYTHRPQQAALASAIEESIASGTHLLADAPVGIGKSMAALIPAIYAAVYEGKRVIVATATNVLAAQYAEKDLPFLEEHLGVEFTWAMVKGRGNYYCRAEGEDNADSSQYVERIKRELRENPGHSGDLDKFSFPIPQDERRKLSISSTECPGLSHCQIGRELGCFPHLARVRANDAQIVLTNISSLVVNARLQGALLGHYDVLIIDEGHNLDQYTLGNLEGTINFQGIRNLATESMNFLPSASEPQQVIDAANYMEALMEEIVGRESFMKIDQQLMIDLLDDWLPIFGGLRYIKTILSSVSKDASDTLESDPEDTVHGEVARKASKLVKQAEGILETLEDLVLSEHDFVRWLEKTEIRRRGGQTDSRTYIKVSPIESAPFLKATLFGEVVSESEESQIPSTEEMPPVIVMSGTLSTNGSFTFAKQTLGAWSANEIQVESPFDFQSQSRLYVPSKNMPKPGDFENWLPWYSRTVEEFVDASGGSALLLFTSRRAMEAAHERLAPRFWQQGYRVLIQDGETSNNDLGRTFNEDPSSILFGLKSFFEGFDPALGSCKIVVLDKLPFPVPTDIIFEARAEKVDENGGSSFSDLSIPMLSVSMEQAAGRLIRSQEHRGVFAIMDSRLSSARYGKRIINSLPDMPLVNKTSEVKEFLETI